MLARYLRWFARVAQQQNPPAGCSKRLSSKAAVSEGPEAYPQGYAEGLNDARTLLADFFSILLACPLPSLLGLASVCNLFPSRSDLIDEVVKWQQTSWFQRHSLPPRRFL
jgi:hypothetical protein